MAVHEENINWFYNKIKGLREKMHLGKEILSRVFKKETLKMMVIETQPQGMKMYGKYFPARTIRT